MHEFLGDLGRGAPALSPKLSVWREGGLCCPTLATHTLLLSPPELFTRRATAAVSLVCQPVLVSLLQPFQHISEHYTCLGDNFPPTCSL